LAHGYRTLQQWNQWLSHQSLGHSLLNTEKNLLNKLLAKYFGKHVLLLGVPHQKILLESVTHPCHSLISPLIYRELGDHAAIEADFHELPILTGSIDLVMLPHTLEFVDNPRQLLAEACRIIKPEGLIAICGFNPYSLWGLKSRLLINRKTSWPEHFIQAFDVKSWLQLADFELDAHATTFFRPPFERPFIYNKLYFLEQIGIKCFPLLGGVYVIIARAKVIPLTPIRMKWRQKLNDIRLSSTITGHIASKLK
jgi:SAM-dependent methyltransferase